MPSLRDFMPHGLVILRDIAGMIYRMGESRPKAVLSALHPHRSWEARWSHLELLPPGVLGTLSHVVDGGANDGTWINVLLRFAKPEAVMVVEPNPRLLPQLERVRAEHPCVRPVSAALGAERATMPFHLTYHNHNSSLLRPSGVGDLHGFGVEDTVQVPVIPLDELTHDWSEVSLLKLDLQGYELHALRGARQTLQKTRYVFIEVNFQRQYEEIALFPEVHAALDAAGFELLDLSNLFKRDGRAVWADAVYRRRGISG